MIENYKEAFEKTKLAGTIASGALDEVAKVPAVAGIVAAGTLATMGINAIRKMNKNKEKMDKGETFKKGSTMDNIQKKNQMYKDMGIAK